jgi:protein-S-isoprenylcysteine O-methyltransferase Ste14
MTVDVSRPRDRGPDVKFPPPLLFVAGLGGGVLLDRLLAALVPSIIPATLPVQVVGIAVGVIGLACVYTGIITFRRARTAVYPNRPASQVVTRGIYARTRNPMYLGFTLFYLGGVLVLASVGALALLPVVLLLLYRLVIAREERHLQRAFPEAYADYCARVRRWL